ncbi:MAG: Rieske 2Fe-2S domain-containing protein [Dehalococcoidales bacterium]|nr:Rieske 2Fe-2S domain-containing protein [Dehalococcoidales bacterium]
MSSITATANFIPVAQVSDFQNGTMKAFRADKRQVLVALVDGKFYAADNKCPHLGGNLSLGKLEGTVVTCPLHGSQFDLIDGRVIRWTFWAGFKAKANQMFRPLRPLRVYPVKVEGDNILVGI